MKCNLCDVEINVNSKSPSLLEHMKNNHKDIYDLHKDNPEATVGFRVEFLNMNVMKGDEVEKSESMILEEVCEIPTEVEAIDITQEDSEVISMQYVMFDNKRKHKKDSSQVARKRSWIWKYFDHLSDVVYRCNMCGVVLSTKGSNTNNLNRHMRSKHVDTFRTEKFGEAMMREGTVVDTFGDGNTPYAVKTEEICASNNESPSLKLRRSWVWSYFDYVSTTQAQCKLCRRHINHGGNATGNMNRHLKMIHNKTSSERPDLSWVWKVFEKATGYYTCKICQHRLCKNNHDGDVLAASNHLKREHGVVSSDQIITSECDLED